MTSAAAYETTLVSRHPAGPQRPARPSEARADDGFAALVETGIRSEPGPAERRADRTPPPDAARSSDTADADSRQTEATDAVETAAGGDDAEQAAVVATKASDPASVEAAAAASAPAATAPATPEFAAETLQGVADGTAPEGSATAGLAPAGAPVVTGQDGTAQSASGQSAQRPQQDRTAAAQPTGDADGTADSLQDGTARQDAPKAATTDQPPKSAAPPRPDTLAAKPETATAADDLARTVRSFDPAAPQNAQPATSAPVSAHAAAITQTPQSAPASAAQPVPVNALAIEIAAQARAGNSRFEIRLDPPELGRIDVRLDVDRRGNVTSRLVIERADTYDLLRRDQSTLERALQQAGLKTSDNALEFSLRDQGFAQHREADDVPHSRRVAIHELEATPNEAAAGYARRLAARGGIDIRV